MSDIKAIVTDIEGTTSSISFVRDVLFPYAYEALPDFVLSHAMDPKVRAILHRVAAEANVPADDLNAIVAALRTWILEDRKHGDLKALQGMIWSDGYHGEAFTAPIYPDAVSQLQAWNDQDLPLYVYSSGSVPAQKLLFGHADVGDLQHLFSGWFDTDIGGKRETSSYQSIVDKLGLTADSILFLSDIVAELDAARDAGMRTILVDRLSDYPEPRLDAVATGGHERVTLFTEIKL